jgi:hypothetical protein
MTLNYHLLPSHPTSPKIKLPGQELDLNLEKGSSGQPGEILKSYYPFLSGLCQEP